jgi:hypothetical protein
MKHSLWNGGLLSPYSGSGNVGVVQRQLDRFPAPQVNDLSATIPIFFA